ncbi:MAG: hypothetical protein JOY99_01635 [Sphingomonadaceae bacterium]|nr:hypothetical protein [Sphingomonadaceae bacterium]
MLFFALLLGGDAPSAPTAGPVAAAMATYEQVARTSLANAPQAAIPVCAAVSAASLEHDPSGVRAIESYKGPGHTILGLECQGYLHGVVDALSAAGRSAKP